jgi:hypothetical protein
MYYSNEYRTISRVSQVHVNHNILPVKSEDLSYNRHLSSTSTPPPPLILSLYSHPHAPARSRPHPESRQAMMAEHISIRNSSMNPEQRLHLIQIIQTFLDNTYRLLQILLLDHQRWSKANTKKQAG